jgi:hypothetical protein
MSGRTNTLVGKVLGNFGEFIAGSLTGKKNSKEDGSLASDIKPKDGAGNIDVTKYRWTLSKVDDEVPYIQLKEFKMTVSSLQRQFAAFVTGTSAKATNALDLNKESEAAETLAVYDELYSKDTPTGFVYKFPYFAENTFELNTPSWEAPDDIGAAAGKVAKGVAKFLVGKKGEKIVDAVGEGADLINNYRYPAFGIGDRPKVFKNHSLRTITINFPLFNTVDADEWEQHRDLGYLLMSQNLLNKRDFVVAAPPVFYEILIPGQYYSYAAQMSDIKIKNLGNQRLIDGLMVPDAYEFNLTLTELIQPSKNQFEAIRSGAAENHVQAKIKNQKK